MMFGLMDQRAAPTVTLSNEVLPDWSRVRLDGERHWAVSHRTSVRGVRAMRCGRSSAAASGHHRRPPAAEQQRGGFQQFCGVSATIAGMVFDLGKRGSRVIFTMDDRSGRIEASMFEDVWQQYRTLVAKSAILVVEGFSLRFDEPSKGLAAHCQARVR